jgi:hypothetical protein
MFRQGVFIASEKLVHLVWYQDLLPSSATNLKCGGPGTDSRRSTKGNAVEECIYEIAGVQFDKEIGISPP